MFQVRIVTVDHYMSSPIPELDVTYSVFRKSSIKQVPVIRIFGTTPQGVKTCVHVHGVFPYICIPYDGSESHLKLSYQLAASLDKAINIASGYSTSNTQHVYKVVLVSGIPFYGYHRKRHQFLKIYFYKPSAIKQAVNLLQNGAILNKVFQPHEAHVPFILQFFIDFNLYGMSFIDFDSVKFRRTNHPDLLSNIPREQILPDTIPPMSLSQFEVDASACHISNRPSSQGNGEICNPGIAAIWEDENRRRARLEGALRDAPNLHSQRPHQKPTPSELFYLDRIQHLLDNASQPGDDSSLSGEPAPPSNKSYAIEEPPNTLALDASFVSIHVSEPCPEAQGPSEAAMLEDTIVDEDVALNMSMSQRLSQTLDKSLVLDYDDLELLDALETLADTRGAAVDNDSVLGSQNSKSKCVPHSSNDEEEVNSDGEDEQWNDKTLVPEEDEAMKLFDLTMPDIDENAILNELAQNEPQPGPSRVIHENLQIPQVDGASGLPSKPARKKPKIPQLDGGNDILSKPGRKSLGIRGGIGRPSTVGPQKQSAEDLRYRATGELIFNTKRTAPSTASAVCNPEIKDNPRPVSVLNSVEPSKLLSCTSSEQCLKVDGLHTNAVLMKLPNSIIVSSSGNVAEPVPVVQTEIAAEPYIFLTQSTTDDTVQETERLVCFVPSSTEEAAGPSLPPVAQSSSEELMVSYYSQGLPLQDEDIVRKLQPPVACCSSTVGCSEDCGQSYDCTDAYIDVLANKKAEPLLRGDPSLYQEAPPEKEESFTELISASICKDNENAQDGYVNELSGLKCTDEKSTNSEASCSTSLRRSTRLANQDSVTPAQSIGDSEPEAIWSQFPLRPPENGDELEDPSANLSPCSCGELSVTGIPGFTSTMFNDIRETLGDWGSTGNDAGCSDSEMCRLRGALENNQMEEILQSGTNDLVTEPSTSRRDEVMLFIESQKNKNDCQGTCSKAKRKKASCVPSVPLEDYVTDELLRRGRSPKPGRPRTGKNMDIAKLYCSTPYDSNFVSKKDAKRASRHVRRLRLSVTAQKKRKTQCANSVQMLNPFVKLEKLTKKNIHNVCRKFRVHLKDKSYFGIKSRYSVLTEKMSSLSQNSNHLDITSCSNVSEGVMSRSQRSHNSPMDITKSSVLHSGRPCRFYLRSSAETSLKSEDTLCVIKSHSQLSVKEEIIEVKVEPDSDEDSPKPLAARVSEAKVPLTSKQRARSKKKDRLDLSQTSNSCPSKDQLILMPMHERASAFQEEAPLNSLNPTCEKHLALNSNSKHSESSHSHHFKKTKPPSIADKMNLALDQATNHVLGNDGKTSARKKCYNNVRSKSDFESEDKVHTKDPLKPLQETVPNVERIGLNENFFDDGIKQNVTSSNTETPHKEFSASQGSTPTSVKILCNSTRKRDERSHDSKCSEAISEPTPFVSPSHTTTKMKKAKHEKSSVDTKTGTMASSNSSSTKSIRVMSSGSKQKNDESSLKQDSTVKLKSGLGMNAGCEKVTDVESPSKHLKIKSSSNSNQEEKMPQQLSNSDVLNDDLSQTNERVRVESSREKKRRESSSSSNQEKKSSFLQQVTIEKRKGKPTNTDNSALAESSNLKDRMFSSKSNDTKIQTEQQEHTVSKVLPKFGDAKEHSSQTSNSGKSEMRKKERSNSLNSNQEERKSHDHGRLQRNSYDNFVAVGKCAVKEQITAHKPSPLASMRVSESASKGSSSPKSIPELIPDIKAAACLKAYRIPKRTERDPKEHSMNNNMEKDHLINSQDSPFISFDTSEIHLNISMDMSNERVAPAAESETLLKTCPQTVLKTESFKNRGQILCVDGASNESSSDSSSASHGNNHDASSSRPLLKRPIDDNMEQTCSKLLREEEKQGSCPLTVPNVDKSAIPKSVAHWFAQPYGPWSMWSPASSPRVDHHTHMFSPPRAVSPDKQLNFSGYAAVSHGCMEEEEARDSANDSAALNSSPDVALSSQPIESKSSCVADGRSCLELSAEKEASPSVGKDSSGKTSHSILDMFSEESIDSYEDKGSEEDEENQSIINVTTICLDASPSSNIGSPDSKVYSDEQREGIQSMSQKTCEISNACGKHSSAEDNLFPANTELSNERINHISKLSDESLEIPCGQYTVKKTLQERAQKGPTFFNAFKTLHKPPSRREVVDSLPFVNLPEVVNQEPFFSNYFDVKGKMDVGGNVLDLTSSSCFHLEEFCSHVPGLRGISQQQKRLFGRLWGFSQVKGNFDQLVSCHLNEERTVICPVKRPPSVREVTLWSRLREIARKDRSLMKASKEVPCFPKTDPAPNHQAQNALNISFDSLPLKVSQAHLTIQASTPEATARKSGKTNVISPLLTPILQTESQKVLETRNTKPKKFSKNLPFQPLLPQVLENDKDDIGVGILEDEAPREVLSKEQSNPSPEDSSLRRLLLDSQLCKESGSPLFRHDSDASACQIKGISASPGFKMVFENLQNVKTIKEHQHITLISTEVHVCTCGNLNPDPERDPIRAIFYSVWNDVPENHTTPSSVNGIIAVNSNNSTPLLHRCGIKSVVEYTNDEKSLLQALVSLVHKHDPDILAGFETEMLSWGYMLQRASTLGMNLIQDLSRIPNQNQNQKERKQPEDFEDSNGLSGLKITGRIFLDVWRLFRSEVALQSYTFENLYYHILHQRVCRHSFESLSRWWENPSHLHRWITVQYYQQRVCGVIRLLDQLDIIGRTSELARLFGIQFFEVLSRGSQFRVESMMLRLAKPLNYIPVSPSVQQRAHMRAPECVPLIMEPESRFYTDPMIVLDFQSLYPSMIIAYNYCFSTCLGRVEHLGKSAHFEFGCSELHVKNSYLQQLKDNISVSPSGIAFVTKAVRQGVLPRMLEEILEARLAVKQSMKTHKNDHTLQRVLHARQLGLKLIANVTYGYTSANFSGRMPCIEVGDSVVSKGRETLERAINLVHKNGDWQARVVYGDTDSLFVLVPGRSREEAFRIGAEIASAVTRDNPSPVKLKLEKVYQPSILQTKKRYVGYMYESPDQKEPVYEAKGIETVRRDGCPAVAKMLEKSLKILFETRDVTSVKNYVSHQFSKILAGRANIQDLIFAREYRGKENYRPGACVPALELSKRWLRQDRRAEPRIGERVPYVVVNGPPGSALIHLVRHPNELLSDSSLRYNSVYYITRAIIPPLARCFSLLGTEVLSWYADLPRKSQLSLPIITQAGFKKTISQYFTTMECACCGALTHGGVCSKCRSNPQLLVAILMTKLNNVESTHSSITKICQTCVGRFEPLDCRSLDCPITFRRHQSSLKHEQKGYILELLQDCGLSPHS